MVFSIGVLKSSINNCRNIFAPIKPQTIQINTGSIKYTPGPATDTIVFSKNSSTYFNKQLKNLYNIDSNIKDPVLARKTIDAVSDFCKINKKDKLFSGLKINTEPLNNNSTGYASFDTATKDFNLYFNENFNWKELGKITEDTYNKGEIAVNNPNYFLYKHLGDFLNFKYNPYSNEMVLDRYFANYSADVARKLSDSTNIYDFISHYIAARMSKKQLQKSLKTFFEEQNGNTDIKFPKPVAETFKTGSLHKFKSIEDANKYLSQNYGITADVETTAMANLIAGSADDLSKLIGSKNYFNGLTIKTDASKFSNNSTKASLHWNKDTGEATLYINPAYNWKNNQKFALKDYENGHHPTANPKDSITHELCHWLDFKGNPQRFGTTEFAFSKGERIYNDFGKSITAKVSAYATKSPAEFCAEYICGRINGLKFPNATNKEFLERWNGPILNFAD